MVRRVVRSAELSASPDEVFAFVADLDNLSRWQPGIVSAQRTSDGPMAVGATARVVRDVMGKPVAASLRVTDHQPPRRLAVESTLRGVRVTATLDLAPEGTRTRARLAMEISASGLSALMEPMIAAGAASELDASISRLQAIFTERG